jgi:hypothetical protein
MGCVMDCTRREVTTLAGQIWSNGISYHVPSKIPYGQHFGKLWGDMLREVQLRLQNGNTRGQHLALKIVPNLLKQRFCSGEEGILVKVSAIPGLECYVTYDLEKNEYVVTLQGLRPRSDHFCLVGKILKGEKIS